VSAIDPLDDPDPRRVAEHAHLEGLLRCWNRETGWTPGPDLTLDAVGVRLRTEVRYDSPSGWHRFGPVRPAGAPERELPAAVLAGLLGLEAGGGASGGASGGEELSDLVARTHDSVGRVARFVADRRGSPSPPAGIDDFLDAEQALLLGHLHHPTPKSRDGIGEADLAAWAPELRAATPLHWFSVDTALVRHDAADTSPALRGLDTPALLAELAGLPDPGPGRVLVPAHPWQALDLPRRPAVAPLVESGAVRPLGPHGPAWWPTSSWRTLYHPERSVMLKLSLGLRLTNCRRESTRRELRRGPAVHRLLDAGLGAATLAAYPSFRLVRDPAWLGVFAPDPATGTLAADARLTGLDVSVREVPPGLAGLRCLAGLLAPRPGLGPSVLAGLPAVRRDPGGWLAGYTARVLVPMLHLYSTTGLGLEGHQQNTLLELAADGTVLGGAFRDNQGFYLSRDELGPVEAVLGAEAIALDAMDTAVLDDWLCYYLLFNQALGVVGGLGSAGVADERALLRVLAGELRAALPALAAAGSGSVAGPHGARLVSRWLASATLPSKANLLTRLHGIDEVTAPMSAQAVFVETPNPLVSAL
jgi:siderophore synthetase component